MRLSPATVLLETIDVLPHFDWHSKNANAPRRSSVSPRRQHLSR